MSRTPGSGWGGGPLLYQICPKCGKKKCIYDPVFSVEWHEPFRCILCKKRSDSDILVKKKHPPHMGEWVMNGIKYTFSETEYININDTYLYFDVNRTFATFHKHRIGKLIDRDFCRLVTKREKI